MPSFSKVVKTQAGIYVPVYTAPANKSVTANIRATCLSAGAEKVSIFIAKSAATPVDSQYAIEYEVEISKQKPLGNTGEVLQAGDVILALCSTANVAIRVSGFEEDN